MPKLIIKIQTSMNNKERTIETKKAILQLLLMVNADKRTRAERVSKKQQIEKWDDDEIERRFEQMKTIVQSISVDMKNEIISVL